MYAIVSIHESRRHALISIKGGWQIDISDDVRVMTFQVLSPSGKTHEAAGKVSN